MSEEELLREVVDRLVKNGAGAAWENSSSYDDGASYVDGGTVHNENN